MSEEIHIGLNKETGKFEQVQDLPIAAVDNFLKHIENVPTRWYILTNVPAAIVTTNLEMIDHVEKSFKEAIAIWSLKAPYENASKFVQAIVRADWPDAEDKADEINEAFMETYKSYVKGSVPSAIVIAYQDYHTLSMKKQKNVDNTTIRTSTV